MSKWKPMKTAPKDGTKLLLVCGPEYEVAYWSQPDRAWLGANRVLYPHAATYWMRIDSLPAPPSPEKPA